jgi:hypothetical protein
MIFRPRVADPNGQRRASSARTMSALGGQLIGTRRVLGIVFASLPLSAGRRLTARVGVNLARVEDFAELGAISGRASRGHFFSLTLVLSCFQVEISTGRAKARAKRKLARAKRSRDCVIYSTPRSSRQPPLVTVRRVVGAGNLAKRHRPGHC